MRYINSFLTLTLCHAPVWVMSVPRRIPEIVGYWPEFLILAIDRPATINCEADGWPPPTKSWYKERVELSNTSRITVFGNGSLGFQSVELDDSGKYVCVAGNSLGVRGSLPINVTVACWYSAQRLINHCSFSSLNNV